MACPALVAESWGCAAAQACSDDVQTLCSHLAEGESSLSCLRYNCDLLILNIASSSWLIPDWQSICEPTMRNFLQRCLFFPQACEVNKCTLSLLHSLRSLLIAVLVMAVPYTQKFMLLHRNNSTHLVPCCSLHTYLQNRTFCNAMQCSWLKCNAGSTGTRYLEIAHQRSSDVRRMQQMTSDWTRSCTLLVRSPPVTSPLLMQPAAPLLSLSPMTCARQQPAAAFDLLLKRSYNDQETVILAPTASLLGLLVRASH